METMFGFAAVVLATLVSLFAALALQGLLMKLAFQLMQPATADRRVVAKPPIERGTQMVARVYARETR
jgi:membrane carboxypeptidase/penicillin-binding protein PbpC